MALSSHFISRPAVFGFALIYGFYVRHLSVCNLSPVAAARRRMCHDAYSLHTKLLYVIFIPDQTAGVRANRDLYGGVFKL